MLFSKTRIKIVFLWILFFYLFLFPVISQAYFEFDNSINKKRVGEGSIKKNLKSSGYWNLEFKIHIDNNWSETDSTYDWCSGSGTWSDPYVIENVTVNGANSGSPILIENSNVYFRIKNCTVYNSSSGIFPIYEGGIKMVNVTKGTLINNIAFNNKFGIFLYHSENNTLSGNTANNNTSFGIRLAESNNNIVWENIVNNNKMLGMYLYNSDNNTISGNSVNNNNGEGIMLYTSNNNTISGNNVNNNNGEGILLYNRSNKNNISGNTANNNERAGILGGSYNNTISGNTANNNTMYGIYLHHGKNNTLSGNTVNNNKRHGMELYDSDNTNLSGNTANNNKGSGIVVHSKNNYLSGNTANSNNESGIYLHHSNKNTLSGNTANYNNESGIFLHYSDNLTLSGNIANYNIESGIYLYYSDNNSVSVNIANNNYYGINLTASDFNDITENTLFDNDICYSEDETSIGNTFKFNICVKGEDNWIISGVIGIIVASIILMGISVLYWQFKRKVK